MARVRGQGEGSSEAGHSGVQCRDKGGARRIAGEGRGIWYMMEGSTGQREEEVRSENRDGHGQSLVLGSAECK